MEPTRTFTAPGDGLTLRLAEWPGQGRTVLGLHGLTANLRCFEGIAQGLGGAHRLLAMDLRGRGLSDKPARGYSLDHHCSDIRAMLTGMELAPVVLMGHSLGAYISLAFAAGHPGLTNGLILLDGGGELSPQEWSKVAAGIQPSVDRLGKVTPSLEAYLDLMRQVPYYDPWSRSIENYFRYDVETVPGGVRPRATPENIAEERANLALIEPSRFYPLIKCPVLILRATKGMLGTDDILLPDGPLDTMLRAMPQARAVDLSDANHFSLVFQPNPARDAAIQEFLAR
jgi:pimeloyl-ACP methyl ester carboxylesterase